MERKRTPLYDKHIESGAEMVEFCGWEMPVKYSSIVKEVLAVRSNAGIFDCSHMGEFIVSGPCALDFIQKVSANNASRLKIGQIQYSFLCNKEGGVIDDILIYRLGRQDYMFVVNAGNADKDFRWLESYIIPGMFLCDISANTALVAIQGPYAEFITRQSVYYGRYRTKKDEKWGEEGRKLKDMRYYHFNFVEILGKKMLVSRTGYTGEDGFEIFCYPEDAPMVWDGLLQAGNDDNDDCETIPCGLGARDILRLEAGMPLWGHELNEEITPIEANLQKYIYFDKDFIGKEAIFRKAGNGKKLVGFEMDGRPIARNSDNKIYDMDTDGEIGYVTSGTRSSTLDKSIGMAYISFGYFIIGKQKIAIDIRGTKHPAKIVSLPFYKGRR